MKSSLEHQYLIYSHRFLEPAIVAERRLVKHHPKWEHFEGKNTEASRNPIGSFVLVLVVANVRNEDRSACASELEALICSNEKCQAFVL